MTSTQLPACVANIFRDGKPRDPRVQIIKLTAMGKGDDAAGPKKYKAVVSDGEQFGIAVLNSSCASLITSEAVKLNQIVVLKEYIVNTVGEKKMCIVMKMEVKEGEDVEMEKIGEPVSWETVSAAESPPPARSQSATAATDKPSAPTTSQTSRFAPNFSSSPPLASSSPLVATRATPIEGLNPYSNKWMIKALVTAKSEMRSFSNSQGASSVFSIDLSDDSGEIRATAWREVADRLYPLVEVGKTYLISRGQLKVANKKFSTLNNSYEITLSYESQLQLCVDEPDVKPKMHYRFVQIADIESRPVNAIVDILGVVSNVSAATSITTKTGRELAKRTMAVADDSGKQIELTLWGATASSFPDDAETRVVAFKGMRVTEWNQRSLGSGQSSSFEVDPDVEGTDRIKSWYEGGGSSATVSLSQDTRGSRTSGVDKDARITIREMSEKGEQAVSEPAWGSLRGYISKHLAGPSSQGEEKPMWFSSCPKCTKKVLGDDASGYSCENCGWSGAECSYRYLLPLVLVDSESTVVATAFNDVAEKLLGTPASELKRLKDTDMAAFEATFGKAQWKPQLFRMRAQMSTYNNVSRVKSTIFASSTISFVSEGNLLLKDIAQYNLETKPAAAPDVKQEA
jgi:replication factor A1